MTPTSKFRHILVIQARLNPDVITAEQKNLNKIAAATGYILTFVNPLRDDKDINWNHPKMVLDQYNASIWLGSAEVNLSLDTPERKKYLERVLPLAHKILKEDIPTLGICLGLQTFAFAAGAKIERDIQKREFGTTALRLTEEGQHYPIFNSFPNTIPMVFAHNDSVINVPPGFIVLGSTLRNRLAALQKGNVIMLQGHPEITDTTKLKKRIKLAQKATHLPAYNFTSPLVDPGPTSKMITNFLKTI